MYHVTSSVLEPEISHEKNLFGSCNARICGRILSDYRTLLFSIWLMKSLKDIVFCVQQFRYLFQMFYDTVNIEITAYVTCN